jgi:hypothetical protein
MDLAIATKCLSEKIEASKTFFYQLVTITLRLIAEALGLGLVAVHWRRDDDAENRALSQMFVRQHVGYDLPLKRLVSREGEMMISSKGAHVQKDIILTRVCWYVAYPLGYRQLEELMQERGVAVDHATINREGLQYRPPWEAAFHRRA